MTPIGTSELEQEGLSPGGLMIFLRKERSHRAPLHFSRERLYGVIVGDGVPV
jgi:hypothetical protein